MQPQPFSALSESLRKRVPFELNPTNLSGVFTTPAPAHEFDPYRASVAALIRNGVMWRRPLPGDSLHLIRAWDRVFSRKWLPGDRIAPVLEPQKGTSHALLGLSGDGGTYTSRNWSGAVIQGQWTTVVGSWLLPAAEPSGGTHGSREIRSSSCWVGIDGFSSDDALKAGVQRRVDSTGRAEFVAWCEWYAPPQPDSPAYIWQTDIRNFALRPGQRVYCSVQYISNKSAGHLCFANDSTGQHVSITMAPPPGAAAAGDSIEWIAEAAAGGEEAGESLAGVPPARFSTALGCSADGQRVGLPQNGDRIHIGIQSRTVTSVEISEDAVTVIFVG